MKATSTTGLVFLTGLIGGLVVYHSVMVINGQTPVSRELLDEQRAELEQLREENLELTEELFSPRSWSGLDFGSGELPYDSLADAAAMVDNARIEAQSEGKFLMVTFGANWCLDCRTLYHHLNSEPVASYATGLFKFVNVDVGKFNQNRDVAEALGVSLTVGIPVAIFFDPEGNVVGTTNEGQLEPARHYSSQQILKFVRDIAERSRILAPDSVE
jgi:thioredoxin 1